MSYLFSFEGRFNRAKMWLFFLITLAWELIIFAIAAFGFDWTNWLKSFETAASQTVPGEPMDMTQLVWPTIGSPLSVVASTLIALLVLGLFWALFALYVKRLHDRNKSALWLIPYFIVPAALQFYVKASAHSIMAPVGVQMSATATAAYGVAVLISLWVSIELWFFRGTAGDNRFGPDPLRR